MNLAIFDLDETLIAGDAATLWLGFLAEQGLVSDGLLAEERRLMEHYYAGTLDMNAYMALTLAPLEGQGPETLAPLVNTFIRERIAPIVYPQARERLDWHRALGHRCLIISATGEHLVKPIAQHLGVADAIGVQTEMKNGRYSGQPGRCFQFSARQGSAPGSLAAGSQPGTRLLLWLQRLPQRSAAAGIRGRGGGDQRR